MTSCWVLTDGKAGTENQCIGLAEAMGLSPVIKRVSLAAPWKSVSPYLRLAGLSCVREKDCLSPPWPDLLVASGRQSVEPALAIKQASCGKTFLVQVQDPHVSAKRFDLVIVPRHDRLRGENVMVTRGALCRITKGKLESAARAFSGRFDHLPHPRVAVLIGGASSAYRLPVALAEKMVQDLSALPAGLMVTASRRTGGEQAEILRRGLSGKNVCFWDGTGDNPYFAMLAAADAILVTSDSASMASEAATTGKPIYILSLEGGSKKFGRFHALMEMDGVSRPFAGKIENWNYTPFSDTADAATRVKGMMMERKLWHE
ncbi:MAG TPA: hypothetical protein DCW68_04220 [Rhodospirillaceae bacterium]|nr:MAG: hypothetical protein A2018_07405 [Alphaproteobacteria bacterium GWF2_58_20]HAU29301.1 hypothetical protein [Rhodospirillaceae bacterium]